MRVVFMRPRATAATAGCVRTAGSTSAEAVSLSSTSSSTGALFRTGASVGPALAGVGQEHPALTHRVGQLAQHAHRCVPADARVGVTDPERERLIRDEILPAQIDVPALHRADHV